MIVLKLFVKYVIELILAAYTAEFVYEQQGNRKINPKLFKKKGNTKLLQEGLVKQMLRGNLMKVLKMEVLRIAFLQD